MTTAPLSRRPWGVKPALVLAGLVVVLVAGTLALWAQYGTAVFYEMILAGLAACL